MLKFYYMYLSLLMPFVIQAAPLKIHPAKTLLSSPFMITLEYARGRCILGNFSTTIALKDNTLEITIRPNEEEDCFIMPTVPTILNHTIGPFYLHDTDVSVNDILDVRVILEDIAAISTIFLADALEIIDTPEDSQKPQSGTYWDKEFAGTGFSFETQQDTTFFTLYAYDDQGQAQWYSGSGKINNNVLAGELKDFKNGSCILCDIPRTFNVHEEDDESFPFQVTFGGIGAPAFMTIGNQVQKALTLERFIFHTQLSEPSLMDQSFTMPDLTGQWLFTGLDDNETKIMANFVRGQSGITDSGALIYESTDSETRYVIQCIGNLGNLNGCNIKESNKDSIVEIIFATFDAYQISHDRLVSDHVIGIKLD